MKRAFSISLGVALTGVATAGDSLDSVALRSIHAKLAPSVVRVESVVRKQLENGVDVDLDQQGIGIVVKPNLVMTTAEAFHDATTLGSRIAALRVVVAGGAEYVGELQGVAGADNLAFISIADPEFAGVPVEFASDDTLAVGDFFATLRLSGPSFRSTPYVDAFLVSAALAEPRCYVTTYAIADYLGSAVVAFDGRIVGLVNRMSLFSRAPRVDPVTGQRELEILADVQGYDGDGEEIVIVPASRLAAVIANPPTLESVTPRERPWLGIETQIMLPALARAMGVAAGRRGVLVTRVLPGSPAETVGLNVGDFIHAFDGVALESQAEGDGGEVTALLARHVPGARVKLAIERAGEDLVLEPELGTAPANAAKATKRECESFGFAVRDLVYADRADLDLPLDTEGARATLVKRTGFAGLGGLKVGDVVLRVDGESVRDSAELVARLESLATEQAGSITLFVARGADTLFVEMRPDWAAARR